MLDAIDADMRAVRIAKYNAMEGPRVGDFVEFADGVLRRISHIWMEEGNPQPDDSIQTSDGGNWYLGNSGVSLSNGSLHPGVKRSTLTPTTQRRVGDVWMFHHDQWTARNGVHWLETFRVFKCSEPAN